MCTAEIARSGSFRATAYLKTILDLRRASRKNRSFDDDGAACLLLLHSLTQGRTIEQIEPLFLANAFVLSLWVNFDDCGLECIETMVADSRAYLIQLLADHPATPSSARLMTSLHVHIQLQGKMEAVSIASMIELFDSPIGQ